MKHQLLLLTGFLVLVAIGAVALATPWQSAALNAAATHASCNVALITGHIDSILSNVPNIPNAQQLTQDKTTLTNDLSQLQTYANSGDISNYRSFLTSTYAADLRNTNTDVRNSRLSFAGLNVSKSTKQAIISNYQTLRSTFETCTASALKDFGNDKIQYYNAEIANYTLKMNNLTAKGINTTGINQVLQNAQSEVITPLQNAVNSDTNATQLRDDINHYCLYNCEGGFSYHLAANFEIQKVNAIFSYLSAQPNATAANTQLNQAQTYISKAQSVLSAVGTSAYTSGQSNQIFDNIKLAYQYLQLAMKAMRG